MAEMSRLSKILGKVEALWGTQVPCIHALVKTEILRDAHWDEVDQIGQIVYFRSHARLLLG